MAIETKQEWKIDKGGALHLLPEIPDKSIDMILTDLPYGTTACDWDNVIDLVKLWNEYERIVKDNTPVILFSSGLFTYELALSNKRLYKYDLVWKKSKSGSPFTAKYMPMRKHEIIIVFGKGTIKYNPQMEEGTPYSRKWTPYKLNNMKFGVKGVETNNDGTRYPSTILDFPQLWRKQDQIHTTQKPLSLIEYLIKTYSNEGDMVHDSCLGSGTTLEACVNLNRNCIAFEISDEWEWNYRAIMDNKKNMYQLSKIFKMKC